MCAKRNEFIINKPLFESAINHTKDAIIITDKNQNIIYINDAFEEMTGYDFEEIKHTNPRFLQGEKTDVFDCSRNPILKVFARIKF